MYICSKSTCDGSRLKTPFIWLSLAGVEPEMYRTDIPIVVYKQHEAVLAG